MEELMRKLAYNVCRELGEDLYSVHDATKYLDAEMDDYYVVVKVRFDYEDHDTGCLVLKKVFDYEVDTCQRGEEDIEFDHDTFCKYLHEYEKDYEENGLC